MIGISLSFCVRDMAKGQAPAVVEKIITGCRAINDEAWDEIIKRYKESYWKGLDNAETICRKLIANGKIVQPRLTGGSAPYVGQGHWVESEDQIVWC